MAESLSQDSARTKHDPDAEKRRFTFKSFEERALFSHVENQNNCGVTTNARLIYDECPRTTF